MGNVYSERVKRSGNGGTILAIVLALSLLVGMSGFLTPDAKVLVGHKAMIVLVMACLVAAMVLTAIIYRYRGTEVVAAALSSATARDQSPALGRQVIDTLFQPRRR